MKRRKKTPMPTKYDELARYNSQVSQGLLHNRYTVIRMAELQREFDRWAEKNR